MEVQSPQKHLIRKISMCWSNSWRSFRKSVLKKLLSLKLVHICEMKFLTHWILLVMLGTLGYLGTQQTYSSSARTTPKKSVSKENIPTQTAFDFVVLEETEDDFQDQISTHLPAPASKICFGFFYLLLIFSAIRMGQSVDRTLPYYIAFENLRI
jgi:hypothetical protein